MAFLVLLLLALPLVIAFSPRAMIVPVLACSVLLIGLMLLDLRTHQPDGPGSGLGMLILILWFYTVIPIGICRFMLALSQLGDDGIDPFGKPQLRWSAVPLAILFAVCFLHWLSNRLAGFQPSVLPHLALAVGGVGSAVSTYQFARSRGWQAHPFVVALCTVAITIALIVASYAVKARSFANEAGEYAAGAPYCFLNAYGYHWKPARSWLDLSPLVMRDRGRYGIDTGYWLLVRQPNKTVGRYTWYRKGAGFFMPQEARLINMTECWPR